MTDAPIIGVVTPPGWYDPTLMELTEVFRDPVRVQQSIVDVPDLDFDDLNAIARTEPMVARAARLMGQTGAAALAMTGTPFVWAGCATEAEARGRLDRITEAAGCPVAMAGTAVIDVLRRIGVRRIALCTPYYTQSWQDQAKKIFVSAGFDVRVAMSAGQAGLTGENTSIQDHSDASGPAIVCDLLRSIASAAPDAEAIVSLGSGVRMLDLTSEMEAELQRPIVASDTAVYWSLAQELSLPLQPGVLGPHSGRLWSDPSHGEP